MTESRLVSTLQVLIGGHVVAAGLATYFGNETWYKHCIMPIQARLLDPETSHRLAVKAASYGLVPKMKLRDHPELSTEVLGIRFQNPIGLAAGFDKHGEAIDGMLKIGFGFVEVGTVTPQPQDGNPRPRVFRLLKDRAVINRYGFNSEGHAVVAARLKQRQEQSQNVEQAIPNSRNRLNENWWSPGLPKVFFKSPRVQPGVVGVNLGKNKSSADGKEITDYVDGVVQFAGLADYLVMNVSSPNTPGLRSLQGRDQLEHLITKVVEARNKLPGKRTPLFVKIAPDLTKEEKSDIAAVVLKLKSGVDGLIVSNTTISRPASLCCPERGEVGGLSGAPVKDLATETIRDMHRLTNGKIVIIGVGGISCGQDAYDKIRAGASLVQLYTGFVYEGPPLVPRIVNELAALLQKDGFSHVSDAVGVDSKR